MTKKADFQLNQTLILNLTLVLKVLPVSWIYALHESFNIDRAKVKPLIHGLEKNGFITFEQKYPGERFLFLTQKGFDRACRSVEPNYTYNTWSKGATRTETIFRHHHYITFRFLLEFLAEPSKLANIYVDYDKKCKLTFKSGNYDYNIYPDALIRTNEEGNYHKIIALEADTGQEEIKRLFDKLLRYLIFIHKNLASEDIEQVKVFFSFATRKRADSVFKMPENNNKNGLLYSMYNQGTRINFLSDKAPDSLGIREFFNILKEDKIKIYFGTIEENSQDFEEVDFLNNILALCPKTADLYKQTYKD